MRHSLKIQNKLIFRLGVVLGLIGMVAGSAGAHGIKFETDKLKSFFDIGLMYMFFHIPILMILATLGKTKPAILMFAGVILFSAPLLLKGMGLFDGGIIVPIGGMMMIAAWVWLIFVGNDVNKEDKA